MHTLFKIMGYVIDESKLNNYVCPISKPLSLSSPTGNSSYYNPGPHGQRRELGSGSGQYDSSIFFYFFFFFDVNIVSATCLVIACLLVLMGFVKEIFYINVRKHFWGPSRRWRVNNCAADNGAAVEYALLHNARKRKGGLKGDRTIIALTLIDFKISSCKETSLFFTAKSCYDCMLETLHSASGSKVHSWPWLSGSLKKKRVQGFGHVTKSAAD